MIEFYFYKEGWTESNKPIEKLSFEMKDTVDYNFERLHEKSDKGIELKFIKHPELDGKYYIIEKIIYFGKKNYIPKIQIALWNIDEDKLLYASCFKLSDEHKYTFCEITDTFEKNIFNCELPILPNHRMDRISDGNFFYSFETHKNIGDEYDKILSKPQIEVRHSYDSPSSYDRCNFIKTNII